MNGGTRRKRLFSLWIQSVCEATWLKGSLMPAETLQPTFTLEISHWCNGLLLATLTATPWSLSVKAVDRQLSVLSDWDNSGPGLHPFFCLLSDISGSRRTSLWHFVSQQPGTDHVTERIFCPSAGSILPQHWQELPLHRMVDKPFCPISFLYRDSSSFPFSWGRIFKCVNCSLKSYFSFLFSLSNVSVLVVPYST